MDELLFTVTGGAVERNEEGKLTGLITTRSPIVSAQRLSEQLGYNKMELLSEDTIVSVDPARPTVFTSNSSTAVPQRARVLNFTYPQTIEVNIRTVISGHLEGQVFKGTFDANIQFISLGQTLAIHGEFEVHVV